MRRGQSFVWRLHEIRICADADVCKIGNCVMMGLRCWGWIPVRRDATQFTPFYNSPAPVPNNKRSKMCERMLCDQTPLYLAFFNILYKQFQARWCEKRLLIESSIHTPYFKFSSKVQIENQKLPTCSSRLYISSSVF